VENFRFTILKHLNGKKAGKYLDFACGDCKVTPYMGKGIGAGKDCVYGADIANWGNYNENTRNVRGMTFVEIPTTGRYPFNDNMFGVISCMMALHHVVDLHGTLGELSRIIKKGGLLYITEHNVTNYVEKMLIDVEHAIYEIGHRQTFGFADTYIGNFKHWTEWTYLLHQHGFEYIEHGELSYDVTDQDDPTKRVWILYKKLS
jgi:ubiquinone/menaquinone biosynthesis C-methylase UbiE